MRSVGFWTRRTTDARDSEILVEALPDYRLFVRFDDGRAVTYDMNDDMNTLPGYSALRDIPGLFKAAQLDESRTCVFWNEYIDLPSDAIYEYGVESP